MSRRRYISTAISLDKNVNRLATEAGDFAALLYTWMIPHAEDDATITGDCEELLFTVAPGRRDKTAEDVEEALVAMAGLYLIARQNGTVYFDSDSFYKYQTYVPPAKRADNSEKFNAALIHNPSTEEVRGYSGTKQRETAKNAASPSLSPSLSPSPSKTLPPTPRKSSTKNHPTCDGEPCDMRLLKCNVRTDIAALVGSSEAASLYGGNSDLSKTLLRYSSRICELCQVTFGEYERPERDAKCAAVLRAAIARIRATHRHVDNLPAYLNGELKRMQQLGDVCGDDLVAELRHVPRDTASDLQPIGAVLPKVKVKP